MSEGALVPLTIHLDLIQITPKRRRHMRYEFHYKIESGLWLFDEGTAFEVDEETGTLTERALAEIRNLTIIEESEGPALDELEEPGTPKKPR